MWHLVSKNVRVNSEYKVPPSKTLWVSIIMMSEARVKGEVVATWVEACFCDPPPGGNGAYWEEYFDLLSVKAAHSPAPAATKMGPRLAPAVIAIARRSWKRRCVARANLFFKRLLPEPSLPLGLYLLLVRFGLRLREN